MEPRKKHYIPKKKIEKTTYYNSCILKLESSIIGQKQSCEQFGHNSVKQSLAPVKKVSLIP